jgi:hypothetical protein
MRLSGAPNMRRFNPRSRNDFTEENQWPSKPFAGVPHRRWWLSRSSKIAGGELAPGSRLPAQRDLARMLGVGRSSVREAINALVVMGYLEPLQGKGTFIKDGAACRPGYRKTQDRFFRRFHLRFDGGAGAAGVPVSRPGGGTGRCRPDPEPEIGHDEGGGNGKGLQYFSRCGHPFHAAVADAAGNVVLCELTKLVLEKVVAHHIRIENRLAAPGLP